MAAPSMLAAAVIFGTRALGQQVNIALGKADAGKGLIARLAITVAFITILSDRLVQSFVMHRDGE